MNICKGFVAFIMLSFVLLPVLKAQNEFEDYLIKVTENDSIGNFSMHSFQGHIVGVAYLSNQSSPDIFVKSSSSYPDFSRYKCIGRDNNGIPIFGAKEIISLPGTTPNDIFPSHIFQTADKKVHIVWFHSGYIRYGIFNENEKRFVEIRSIAYGTTPRQLTAYYGVDNRLHVILSHVTVQGAGVPEDGLGKFYGSGVFRGKFGFLALYEESFPGFLEGGASSKRLVTSTERDVYSNYNAMSVISLNTSQNESLIGGSQMGEINYYDNIGSSNSPLFQARKPIVDVNGQIIRHPAIAPYPIAYPNESGKFCDIIASSEGGIYYYRFKGSYSAYGNPIYEQPLPVLQKNTELNGGSLVVPTVVDWDGDGNLDIISGNSQGFIYYFKNYGNNINYRFSNPEKLHYKDGEAIHIQGGYGESTQGPGESRWGYTCPNVIDWDNDGNLDILFGDARSKHALIRGSNEGLEDEESIYLNGLNFHGNWRDRPGIAQYEDSTIYITFDEDNNFHLYKKADAYNLIDAGKLKLTNGTFISSGRGLLNAYNETGRAKFEIADWDSDGLLDLLVGTTGFMAIPDPVTGIPHNSISSERKASVLFMKNVGTNLLPRYELPVALSSNGKKLNFGWHSCAVATTKLGSDNDKLNLVVGDERGRYYLFDRKNLSHTSTRYAGVPVEIISHENIPIRPVTNNVKVYLNEEYKLQDSLSYFSGNRFTQINTTIPQGFFVKPTFAGLIYIATDSKELTDDLNKEWKKLAYSGLKYGLDDNNMYNYTIYYRVSKEGEKVFIPKLGSLGSIVLSTSIVVGEDEPSSISEPIFYSSNYKIYPNPTSDLIKIEKKRSEILFNEKITIHSILGENMHSGDLEAGNVIDVSMYPKGVYIISIGNDSIKFIKQ